jgi:hypothetical protein
METRRGVVRSGPGEERRVEGGRLLDRLGGGRDRVEGARVDRGRRRGERVEAGRALGRGGRNESDHLETDRKMDC